MANVRKIAAHNARNGPKYSLGLNGGWVAGGRPLLRWLWPRPCQLPVVRVPVAQCASMNSSGTAPPCTSLRRLVKAAERALPRCEQALPTSRLRSSGSATLGPAPPRTCRHCAPRRATAAAAQRTACSAAPRPSPTATRCRPNRSTGVTPACSRPVSGAVGARGGRAAQRPARMGPTTSGQSCAPAPPSLPLVTRALSLALSLLSRQARPPRRAPAVKDQHVNGSKCGCCYAFGGLAGVEAANAKYTGTVSAALRCAALLCGVPGVLCSPGEAPPHGRADE